MAILEPRTARSSGSVMVSRFLPSKRASPEICAPRVRPMIVWVDTLFPDPDSPTMPSVWPGSTENETPRTAWTRPSDVWNDTCKSRTSSSVISCPYFRMSLVGEVEGPRGCSVRRLPPGRSTATEYSLPTTRLAQPDVGHVDPLDGADED